MTKRIVIDLLPQSPEAAGAFEMMQRIRWEVARQLFPELTSPFSVNDLIAPRFKPPSKP